VETFRLRAADSTHEDAKIILLSFSVRDLLFLVLVAILILLLVCKDTKSWEQNKRLRIFYLRNKDKKRYITQFIWIFTQLSQGFACYS